jgi:hypothetical protein
MANTIWKKGKSNCEKDMENTEESKLNSEMIWKIWKKGKLNSDKTWTNMEKGKLNSEKI